MVAKNFLIFLLIGLHVTPGFLIRRVRSNISPRDHEDEQCQCDYCSAKQHRPIIDSRDSSYRILERHNRDSSPGKEKEYPVPLQAFDQSEDSTAAKLTRQDDVHDGNFESKNKFSDFKKFEDLGSEELIFSNNTSEKSWSKDQAWLESPEPFSDPGLERLAYFTESREVVMDTPPPSAASNWKQIGLQSLPEEVQGLQDDKVGTTPNEDPENVVLKSRLLEQPLMNEIEYLRQFLNTLAESQQTGPLEEKKLESNNINKAGNGNKRIGRKIVESLM